MSCNLERREFIPGTLTRDYKKILNRKIGGLAALILACFGVAVFAIAQGNYDIPISDVLQALAGNADPAVSVVVTRIRMPRVAAAVVCGWGLSLSGLCLQSLLKNPLSSPSTLGISHGAAFGAAVSIVFAGTRVFLTTAFAFGGAMAATAIILILSALKRLSTEAVILSGVALSSLFVSATILIQYLSTDTQLAMVVFWTFGDVARSGWTQIGILTAMVVPATLYLVFVRWDLNALASGEETARGLGVRVERLRLTGMVVVSLVSALATAFHGVIAFVGLIAPHMARRLVGDDHTLLIPFSGVLGGLLLLSADTLGRLVIGSGALPVGVITSFLGAPMFLYLLIRGYK